MDRYFPFDTDAFALTVGARALQGAPLVEADDAHYRAELALKRQILAEDPRFYAQALPGSDGAQWEALALVLRDLARQRPGDFRLEVRGDRWRWRNELLGEAARFRYGDAASLPHPPLDWAGRQVQEDLILMGGAAGFPLVAGQLCFANAWSLDEKIGRPFLEIHGPVPQFAEAVGRASGLLLERIKPERPVWRLNWAVRTSPQLNAAPRFRELFEETKRGVTAENAGERCWLRVERQALARLPESGAVLFTIHTYQETVAQVARDAGRARRMLGVLRSTPPEMLAYKGIAPFAAALAGFLERATAPEPPAA